MTDQINMIYSFYCYLLAQNFAIFNSWHMPFSNVPYSSFQKSETLEAFFLYQVFFHRHWQFTGQQGKGGDDTLYHLEYTLPLPPAHEPWDLYLQLCMWNDYHVFLVATFEVTRLLLDEIDHIIKLPFWLIDWLMMQCLFIYLINWF